MRIVLPAVTAAVFLVAIFSAPFAGAECPKPPPAPEMPQGATASEDDMRAGHDALQKYVNALQVYETCYRNLLHDAPPDTKDDTKAVWLAKANLANDKAHEIADVYSIQLRAFRARQ